MKSAVAPKRASAVPQSMLAYLLDASSIEITPREARTAALPAAALNSKLLFVPWLPSSTPEDVVQSVIALRRQGLTPVPHVAVRRLVDEHVAKVLLTRLREEAAVDTLLVIGGDVEEPQGPFASSVEFIRSGLLQACGITRFGCAAYPEGHPRISQRVLSEELDHKLDYAKAHGLQTFIVSQFGFDARHVVVWLDRLRERGIKVPVRIGIAGPTSLARLARLAYRCGIRDSVQALRGRFADLVRLASIHKPDSLLQELAQARGSERHLGELSFHFFAFGGAEATAEWLTNYQRSTAQ